MARKSVTKAKTTKKTSAKRIPAKAVKASKVAPSVLGESYTSLALGIIAVIIGVLLLLSIFSGKQAMHQTPETTPTIVAKSNEFSISPTGFTVKQPEGIAAQQSTQKEQPTIIKSGSKTYTVVAGDNLWTISEKVYGSGYNWTDIANANKLANPGDIHVGDVFQIPSVALKDATVHTADDDQSSTTAIIAEETYTVVKGDDLWDIAVRAYGDGYQWVKIAQANNLANPDIINVGNVLKIPKN